MNIPESLPKLLQAVKWNSRDEVSQVLAISPLLSTAHSCHPFLTSCYLFPFAIFSLSPSLSLYSTPILFSLSSAHTVIPLFAFHICASHSYSPSFSLSFSCKWCIDKGLFLIADDVNLLKSSNCDVICVHFPWCCFLIHMMVQ